MSTPHFTSFRTVPRTGVIFVTTEAAQRGFQSGHPEWCNLGQGMPEAGPLPGAPQRHDTITIDTLDQEYAPVPGLLEMRQAVADLYNQLYRKGMRSQYTAQNVAVAPGGRSALTRACAALGRINLGHFLPDYTAYEELLDVFGAFTSIPILLDPREGYHFSLEALRQEITGRGLGALLVSNPCNPTGKVIGGDELAGWVELARELDCAMLFDEFYSHYLWSGDTPVQSAAAFVEDVDKDPVILFDGLTKNWRYPGWRCGWMIGPRSVVNSVSSAGSFLDGGGARPLQVAALDLLDPAVALQETEAIRTAFRPKREMMLQRLLAMGCEVDLAPEGTFYVWASLEGLPDGINDGMSFFKAALDRKVICVPGEFFDVNPGKRRKGRASRFRHHMRFSFGPTADSLDEGLSRLESLVDAHR